jgi:hypothetical protein
MRRQETLFRFSLSISPLILTILSHFTSRSGLQLTFPNLTFTPRALLYSSDALGRLLPILFSPWSVAESVPIAISRFGQCVVLVLLPTLITSNSSSSSTTSTTLISILTTTYLLNTVSLLTRTLVGFILTRSVGWMYPEWFYHWALYEESSGFGAGMVVYLAVVAVGCGGVVGFGGNSNNIGDRNSGSDTERTGTLSTTSLPSTSSSYPLQTRTSTPGIPIITTTATLVLGTLFFWLEDRPWTYLSALIVVLAGWTLRLGVGIWWVVVGSGLGGTARNGLGDRERRIRGFEGRMMREEEGGLAFIQRDLDTDVEMDLESKEKAISSTDARVGARSSATSASISTSTRLLPWKRYLILLGTSFLNAIIYHHLLVTHHPPHLQYLPLPPPPSHQTTTEPTRPLLEILILSYPRPPSTEVSERLLTATLDTFVPHTKKGWVGISVFTHSRDHAAMERVREAYSNKNHYGLDNPGDSSSNRKNASGVEVEGDMDLTFYVDEDDHPDDDQGHYLHLSEAFRWISHRSESHHGETIGSEWIMLVEDDFPVCPGGWGAIETVVNKLEKSRRRGVVRSGFVGTGGR